jgi:adenine-specific DNA-methyltransferase
VDLPARLDPLTVEFLGNKTALLPEITGLVSAHVPPGSVVADVFTGTATVAAALRGEGYAVHANDVLPLCETWARTALLGRGDAPFAGLVPLLGDLGVDPYGRVLDHLAGLDPVHGWVTRHYTPASRAEAGVERRYLTVSNGERVDAARAAVREWRPRLTGPERAMLLAALVSAVLAVSNIAGTYGCYLKDWKPRALQPVALVPVPLGTGRTDGHRVTCLDAERAVAETPAALVYADPPYTKRQYAAYYHLLNTLVGDEDPALTGTTGLPRWQRWSSDWCYARRAPEALDRLAGKTAAPLLLLSYSSDGHIPHERILRILGAYGVVRVVEVERRRYKSSRLAHRAPTVLERFYLMSR